MDILLTWIIISIYGTISKGYNYSFPYNFKFGVGSAAYQVEGAWNTNGKGESIWDRLTHTRAYMVADYKNGDIACDSYNKIKEDVILLKDLGVDFYRFSVSWPRILPTGFTSEINSDGVRYYNTLIDNLLENGIEPYVTIYHWDLPQLLQYFGGWTNNTIVDHFEGYAKVLYENFGNRVKNWITFNEPTQICEAGYSGTSKAPALNWNGVGGYLCGHNLLKAHARAYRLYDERFKSIQKGKVGITLVADWKEPLFQLRFFHEAADRALQMQIGWFAHPIFSKTGDYPAVMKNRINSISASEGRLESRLPKFTLEEVAYIKGTFDFFGINHYSTQLCFPVMYIGGIGTHSWLDTGTLYHYDSAWESSPATPWLKSVSWGFRKILNWIKNEYGNIEVVVTENGFSDFGEIKDCQRVKYHNLYLEQLLKAIHEDGCNVTGYTVWSLMDSFEWLTGYSEKFGLHHVNFEDQNRTRTPKMSSFMYKNIIKTRRIDWGYIPNNFTSCKIK